MRLEKYSIILFESLKEKLLLNVEIFYKINREEFFFLIGNLSKSMVFHKDNSYDKKDLDLYFYLQTIENIKMQFDYIQGVYGQLKKISKNRNYGYLCAAIALYKDTETVVKQQDYHFIELGLSYPSSLLYC